MLLQRLRSRPLARIDSETIQHEPQCRRTDVARDVIRDGWGLVATPDLVDRTDRLPPSTKAGDRQTFQARRTRATKYQPWRCSLDHENELPRGPSRIQIPACCW